MLIQSYTGNSYYAEDGRILEVICSKQHQHWTRHKVIDSKTLPYDQNYNNGVKSPGGPNYEILPYTEDASKSIDKASKTA